MVQFIEGFIEILNLMMINYNNYLEKDKTEILTQINCYKLNK